LPKTEYNLSDLAKERIKDKAVIPDTLENGNYVMVGIKKYKPYS